MGTAQQDQTTTTPGFIYSSVPFQDAGSNIRLVELFLGQDGNLIYLRLFVVDSVTSHLYEALSYIWGSPANAVTVSVNGAHLAITPNLADSLRCLRPAHGPPHTFWIDAICINQASDTEKAEQVTIMGAIYRAASEVVIFLSAKADDSALVMDYLGLADPPLRVTALAPARPNPRAKAPEDALVRARIWHHGLEGPRLLRAAHAFFARPYWARIWVVQEYALARLLPRFYCGTRHISGADVRACLGLLLTHLTSESWWETGDLAVALFVHGQDDKWECNNRKWNITFGVLHNTDRLGRQERPSKVVIRLARQQSTDPRDRVFAMRELVDLVMRAVFVLDYQVEAGELFTRLTSYLLACDDSPTPYSYFAVNGTGKDQSWALDFTRPLSFLAVGRMSGHEDKEPWMKELRCLSIYHRTLRSTRFSIDIVDTVV